jgi:hypothetical protein
VLAAEVAAAAQASARVLAAVVLEQRVAPAVVAAVVESSWRTLRSSTRAAASQRYTTAIYADSFNRLLRPVGVEGPVELSVRFQPVSINAAGD